MKNYLNLARKIALELSQNKAKQIRIINVREITTITEYFVIATGTSETHLKTLRDILEETLEKKKTRVLHRDGKKSSLWQVVDCGGVIVHLFHPTTRAFYQLERLWSDGKPVTLTKNVRKKKVE